MTLPAFPSFPTGMEILFRSEESLSRSVNGTEGGGGGGAFGRRWGVSSSLMCLPGDNLWPVCFVFFLPVNVKWVQATL